LTWPQGWKRTVVRRDGAFRAGGSRGGGAGRRVEIDDGVNRVYAVLLLMGVKDEGVIISTNVRPSLGSRPGSIQVSDPGVAVYWTDKRQRAQCMAIDQYTRVPDNLAAVANTLEALRAIERYGGAEILDRAFTGFTALPAPESAYRILGVPEGASKGDVQAAYRRLASQHHPDNGGDEEQFKKVTQARDALLG
jgi:hypothetical protein